MRSGGSSGQGHKLCPHPKLGTSSKLVERLLANSVFPVVGARSISLTSVSKEELEGGRAASKTKFPPESLPCGPPFSKPPVEKTPHTELLSHLEPLCSGGTPVSTNLIRTVPPRVVLRSTDLRL